MIGVCGWLSLAAATTWAAGIGATPFEGNIQIIITGTAETNALLYTVRSGHLRIENVATNWPHPVNIVDLNSGAVTLVFPHNRSFVRLKSPERNESRSDFTPTALPPGIGPQGASGAIPSGASGMAAIPMPMEQVKLKATGEKTELLGFTCEKFEIKQRGELMEIWATDKLLPFQLYLQNQRSRVGPRGIEEQWGELLKAKKLFPLRAVLKFENGAERFRFEVKSISPEKVEDKDGTLFQPPPDYYEIQPLPF